MHVCVCVCRHTLVAIEGDVDLVPALVLDVAGWGGKRVHTYEGLHIVVAELSCVCVCVCVDE
jgi:hypothetical protein